MLSFQNFCPGAQTSRSHPSALSDPCEGVEADEGESGEGIRGVGLLRSGGGVGEYRDGVGALLLSDLSLSEGGRERGEIGRAHV